MTGIVLDAVLMLLLVAALGYGVRLERKLTALRAGQLAFAGAVTELNAAAGRAESTLASLRTSGEEADMLHDRILKARAVKQELETLIARGRSIAPISPRLGEDESRQEAVDRPAHRAPVKTATAPEPVEDDRALRMAALAARIQGGVVPTPAAAASRPILARTGRENDNAISGAIAANHAAQQSLNRARRSLDEDLFAA